MANNLKRLLQQNGFTATELANASVSSTTIDKAANNRNGYVPSIVTMVKITEAFNRMLEEKAKRLGQTEYRALTIKDIFPDYEELDLDEKKS